MLGKNLHPAAVTSKESSSSECSSPSSAYSSSGESSNCSEYSAYSKDSKGQSDGASEKSTFGDKYTRRSSSGSESQERFSRRITDDTLKKKRKIVNDIQHEKRKGIDPRSSSEFVDNTKQTKKKSNRDEQGKGETNNKHDDANRKDNGNLKDNVSRNDNGNRKNNGNRKDIREDFKCEGDWKRHVGSKGRESDKRQENRKSEDARKSTTKKFELEQVKSKKALKSRCVDSAVSDENHSTSSDSSSYAGSYAEDYKARDMDNFNDSRKCNSQAEAICNSELEQLKDEFPRQHRLKEKKKLRSRKDRDDYDEEGQDSDGYTKDEKRTHKNTNIKTHSARQKSLNVKSDLKLVRDKQKNMLNDKATDDTVQFQAKNEHKNEEVEMHDMMKMQIDTKTDPGRKCETVRQEKVSLFISWLETASKLSDSLIPYAFNNSLIKQIQAILLQGDNDDSEVAAPVVKSAANIAAPSTAVSAVSVAHISANNQHRENAFDVNNALTTMCIETLVWSPKQKPLIWIYSNFKHDNHVFVESAMKLNGLVTKYVSASLCRKAAVRLPDFNRKTVSEVVVSLLPISDLRLFGWDAFRGTMNQHTLPYVYNVLNVASRQSIAEITDSNINDVNVNDSDMHKDAKALNRNGNKKRECEPEHCSAIKENLCFKASSSVESKESGDSVDSKQINKFSNDFDEVNRNCERYNVHGKKEIRNVGETSSVQDTAYQTVAHEAYEKYKDCVYKDFIQWKCNNPNFSEVHAIEGAAALLCARVVNALANMKELTELQRSVFDDNFVEQLAKYYQDMFTRRPALSVDAARGALRYVEKIAQNSIREKRNRKKSMKNKSHKNSDVSDQEPTNNNKSPKTSSKRKYQKKVKTTDAAIQTEK